MPHHHLLLHPSPWVNVVFLGVLLIKLLVNLSYLKFLYYLISIKADKCIEIFPGKMPELRYHENVPIF